MGKRVAVVLSGCGFLDGAEIHEAVITLLHLDRAGAEIVCCAPEIPQADVVNHVCKEKQAGEKRRVLIESARIARGRIKPLSEVSAGAVDAVILPGGFGAAKNLCTFAAAGPACEVNGDVARLLRDARKTGKPIGVICIAPVVAAKVLGGVEPKVSLTIGNDAETAKAIEAMGARHVNCAVDQIVTDEANKIVSTPAYMLARGPADVDAGVGKLVAKVLQLCG
ncbi:MAG: Glyoxalase ElbB [Phycisphaerae bacterium]|nr:Glyoxalase ElbB [Phycisphaerae bacterium]